MRKKKEAPRPENHVRNAHQTQGETEDLGLNLREEEGLHQGVLEIARHSIMVPQNIDQEDDLHHQNHHRVDLEGNRRHAKDVTDRHQSHHQGGHQGVCLRLQDVDHLHHQGASRQLEDAEMPVRLQDDLQEDHHHPAGGGRLVKIGQHLLPRHQSR